jgi:predicted thioesterase
MLEQVINSVYTLQIEVKPEMAAILDDTLIHPVYSTFWLVYHAELAARKAIEPYFEQGEQAIGGAVSVQHKAMAAIGEQVCIQAAVESIKGSVIVCSIKAYLQDNTIIAEGQQTQLLLSREYIDSLIEKAYTRHHSSHK